jgi:hypothetical protein
MPTFLQKQQQELERERLEKEKISQDPAKARANAIQLITSRRLQKLNGSGGGGQESHGTLNDNHDVVVNAIAQSESAPRRDRLNMLGSLAARVNQVSDTDLKSQSDDPAPSAIAQLSIPEGEERVQICTQFEDSNYDFLAPKGEKGSKTHYDEG